MTIPASIIASIQATTTDEVFLALLTIRFDATRVYRIVNNTESIVSRGETFEAWPFELTLPNQLDKTSAMAELSFDNVDPLIWQIFRELTEIPRTTIEVIAASTPDIVILSVENLKIRNAQATPQTVKAELYVDSIWQIGYPANDYLPGEYPGLFTAT